MDFYLQTLSETAQIVVPIFLLMLSGFVLRRLKVIDDVFVDQASRLVFNLTLPILIFLSIARTDFPQLFSARQLIYVYGATLGSVVLLWLWTRRRVSDHADRGVFIQGAYRGNFGIIGLAVVFNMLGEPGIAPAALLLALIIPLYNLVAIVVLIQPSSGGITMRSLFRIIARNPMIIALVTALPFSLWHWPLPTLVHSTGEYFADLTLPLALLTIGGSLDLKYLRQSSRLAMLSSFLKLVLLPLLLTLGAAMAGFRGEELAILFVLFGSPTAAVSYVMARAMGGNSRLAGNIVALTTLGSILTLGTGIFILKLFAL